MANSTWRWLFCALAIAVFGWPAPGLAFKRRPNGCDWIGGDFAEPGEVIFNTGCRAGVRRPVRKATAPADQPPKLLDRLDARAPANYGATTRKLIGSGIESFQIVGGKTAYGLAAGGRLWRFVLGGPDSTEVAQSVRRFVATADGALFILENDGTLWRAKGDGTERAFIDHHVADFQPVGDVVYVISAENKRLWRVHGDGKARDLVDESVGAFEAIDGSTIFVLGTDGALWRERGDFHAREKIGQPIVAFDYVAEGDATYVLTPGHILWRRTGQGQPLQVDHDVAAFHPADMNVVYVLGADGRLWQELGDRAHATLVDGDLALKAGAAAFQFAGSADKDGQAVFLLDRGHTLWAETMPSPRVDAAAKP